MVHKPQIGVGVSGKKRRGWVDPAAAALEAQQIEKELKGQIALLERRRAIVDAQESLLAYTKFTMPDPEAPNDHTRSRYEAAKVHQVTAQAIDDFVNGRLRFDDGSVCRQLIFSQPPRHGKSEIATRRLTAWLSGRKPEWDIAVASYSDTMATDFGADIRAILTSAQHKQVFANYRLRRGGTAKDNIQTDQGGRIVCVGRGGALTGRGMMIGIGDDLFKDHEEARSQAIRDQAWHWFTKVFMTRRMGPKLVLLVMTRWHSDDIIGRLTDPENPNYNEIEASKWKIIRLPAIAEEADPLGRKAGEALWPERYDLDFLESQQRLDPLGFAALYQQRPTVADGVLFRRENLRFYEPKEIPEELRVYCASDHAVATGQRNDFTVLVKIGVDRAGHIWLLDCWWQRQKTDVVVEAMLTMGCSGKHRPLIWWAEKGHISKSIGPFLKKRMVETGQFMNVAEVTPIGDKEQRAQSIAARVGMGYVRFPRAAVWTERAVNELLAFPNGTHDDFVDAMSLVGLGLRSQFAPKAAERPAPKQARFGTLNWVKEQDKWARERRETSLRGGF